MLEIAQGLFGIICLLALAFSLSEDKKAVAWRVVLISLAMQFCLAAVLLWMPGSQKIFVILNSMVMALENATRAGTSFVFGYLGGDTIPFEATGEGSTYILAFRGLPLVLVISAISSLLFYWNILPRVVQGFAWMLRRVLGISGSEGLGVAANVFLGMVEAPLVIKRYIPSLHRGEIFTLMASGMATIAGTVMVLYAGLLRPVLPDAMGHLLIASILSAPAAVAIARIMVPVPSSQLTSADSLIPSDAAGSMEAITNGTLEGVKLLINIIAMLIVLVALVALLNQLLAALPAVAGDPLTLQRIFGWCLAPVVWLMGVPWGESLQAGSLLGIKTVLNEFIAYRELAEQGQMLSERSRLIMTYALCGFANPGSLGIILGGLGGLAPERRAEIVSLGLRSIVAGTLATCMTGTIVGLCY